MPWLAESTIQQVKQYQDIVGVVSEYVSLKRRGRNYIGLCPFHSERTPSFTVSPEKKIFHCFGCHESGDLIAFVQKVDNLAFIEAVESIAKRANIAIEYDDSKQETSSKDDALRETVREILSETRVQFSLLMKDSNSVKTYLTRRGLTEETIQQFSLGYAPPSFNLLKWLQAQNYTVEQIKQSGLFFQTEQGVLVSRYKNRIIFPILDYMGRTLGLGGRIFELNQQGAKYINSEESIVFNKRHILYGLYLAKSVIRKQDSVILVEGYMDVLMCHQLGFKNTVGVMGTSLTHEQIQKIKRFSSNIVLCMDSDKAGQAAMERSCELLLTHKCQVKIMRLDDKDPADFLITNDKDAFHERLVSAQSIIEFMLERACQKWDISVIENIPKVIECLVPYLRLESEQIIQQHYIQKVAGQLQVSTELIMAKIQNYRYNVREGFSQSAGQYKTKRQKAEELLIVFSATDLSLREKIFENLCPTQFSDERLSKIAEVLVNSNQINSDLLNSIELDTIKKELIQLLLKADALNLTTPVKEEWIDFINLIRLEQSKQRILEIKKELNIIEEKGEDKEAMQLLQELQSLNASVKGGHFHD